MIYTDLEYLRDGENCKRTTMKEVSDLKIVSLIVKEMKEAWTDGAGLAAIQIGYGLRFGWYKTRLAEGILLNPEITKKYRESVEIEGCLSIPNKWFRVSRALTIDYISNGKKKVANGFLARLIQHEIDHMDGILICDIGKEVDKGEYSDRQTKQEEGSTVKTAEDELPNIEVEGSKIVDGGDK